MRAVTGRRPIIGEIVIEAAAPGRPAAAMVGQTQEKTVLRSVGLLGMVAGTAGVNVFPEPRSLFL